MEAIMCHDRSYASETKAEAERQKELAAEREQAVKRQQVVDTLRQEVNMPRNPSPAPVKEIAPAK
jgi:hypothetical protein